jgi:hypothetical protein
MITTESIFKVSILESIEDDAVIFSYLLRIKEKSIKEVQLILDCLSDDDSDTAIYNQGGQKTAYIWDFRHFLYLDIANEINVDDGLKLIWSMGIFENTKSLLYDWEHCIRDIKSTFFIKDMYSRGSTLESLKENMVHWRVIRNKNHIHIPLESPFELIDKKEKKGKVTVKMLIGPVKF